MSKKKNKLWWIIPITLVLALIIGSILIFPLFIKSQSDTFSSNANGIVLGATFFDKDGNPFTDISQTRDNKNIS